MVVYDPTNRSSFEKVQDWLEAIDTHSLQEPRKYLVATKLDLAGTWQVTEEEGKALARKHNIPFFQTSAKCSTNVLDVFQYIASKCRSGKRKVSESVESVGIIMCFAVGCVWVVCLDDLYENRIREGYTSCHHPSHLVVSRPVSETTCCGGWTFAVSRKEKKTNHHFYGSVAK